MISLNSGAQYDPVPVLLEDGKVIQVGWQGRSCVADFGKGTSEKETHGIVDAALVRKIDSSFARIECRAVCRKTILHC